MATEAGSSIDLTSATVTINGSLTTFTCTEGTVSTPTGTAASIQMWNANATTHVYRALLVPQTVAVNAKFITVTIGDKNYNYTLAENKAFTAANNYSYTLTVKLKTADNISVQTKG